MWIFTSKGFISAVNHRDIPNTLMIRARKLAHLRDLFPGREVTQVSPSDYKYRITIGKPDFAHWMAQQIQDLSYDNFKNSIPDHEYHDACSSVWGVMHRIQPGSYMPPPDQDDLWNDDLPETTYCSICQLELAEGEDCPDCTRTP